VDVGKEEVAAAADAAFWRCWLAATNALDNGPPFTDDDDDDDDEWHEGGACLLFKLAAASAHPARLVFAPIL